MKRTLGIAFAVLLGLGLSVRSASAGDDYDYYSGAELFVARANTPVYDSPRSSSYTNIRLRAGSYLYASCWDGWEGWCRIRTRYFKNMYLPRYALDSAYGGHRYKSYYYKESSHSDCAYKESYPYRGGGYRESCYDKGSYPEKEYGYKYDSYGKGYGYKRAYSYEKDYGYKGDGYGKEEYGYKRSHAYGQDSGYKAYSYEKDYGYKRPYRGQDGSSSDDYDGGYDQQD